MTGACWYGFFATGTCDVLVPGLAVMSGWSFGWSYSRKCCAGTGADMREERITSLLLRRLILLAEGGTFGFFCVHLLPKRQSGMPGARLYGFSLVGAPLSTYGWSSGCFSSSCVIQGARRGRFRELLIALRARNGYWGHSCHRRPRAQCTGFLRVHRLPNSHSGASAGSLALASM